MKRERDGYRRARDTIKHLDETSIDRQSLPILRLASSCIDTVTDLELLTEGYLLSPASRLRSYMGKGEIRVRRQTESPGSRHCHPSDGEESSHSEEGKISNFGISHSGRVDGEGAVFLRGLILGDRTNEDKLECLLCKVAQGALKSHACSYKPMLFDGFMLRPMPSAMYVLSLAY